MQDLNKRVVMSLYDCISTGDLASLERLFAAEFPGGPPAFRTVIAELRVAFPDIHYTVDDLIAEGDRVVARFSWVGTHRGSFRGHAATNKRIENKGMAIYTLNNGLISFAALETDRLGFLQALGVVPNDAALRAGRAVIDPNVAPTSVYLMDTFKVPASARDEFEAAMKRNRDYIQTLEGFRGDAVLVRKQGDSFDVATIAVWESPEAIARAKDQVFAFYERIGFDMPKAIARWGVTMQRTICTAPPELQ